MAFMPSEKSTIAWVMAHGKCTPQVPCPACRQFHRKALSHQELATAYETLGMVLLSLWSFTCLPLLGNGMFQFKGYNSIAV